MNKTKQLTTVLIIMCIVLFSSCKKDDEKKAAKSFLDLTFNTTEAYFSTDGSMSAPVDSIQAKSMTSKLDITFIYNYSYHEPGFFDPKARSMVWGWDNYYQPWLSLGVETQYYVTTLNKSDFDDAMNDESKIDTYFAGLSLAPHGMFPEGSCIGGRESSNPYSVKLTQRKVFGFKNKATGKRGLLYIRNDQSNGWPMPIYDFDTKVDIIREN